MKLLEKVLVGVVGVIVGIIVTIELWFDIEII